MASATLFALLTDLHRGQLGLPAVLQVTSQKENDELVVGFHSTLTFSSF